MCLQSKGNANAPQCGSLNVIYPHKPIRSGTIRRCGLVGGSLSLCGRVGGVWGFLSFRKLPSVSVWFPDACKMWHSQLLLQHHVCLHTAMLPATMKIEWISETVSEPSQLNALFIRVALVIVSLHRNGNPKTLSIHRENRQNAAVVSVSLRSWKWTSVPSWNSLNLYCWSQVLSVLFPQT